MLMLCRTNIGAEVRNVKWTRRLTDRWKSYYNTYASVIWSNQCHNSELLTINCGEGEIANIVKAYYLSLGQDFPEKYCEAYSDKTPESFILKNIFFSTSASSLLTLSNCSVTFQCKWAIVKCLLLTAWKASVIPATVHVSRSQLFYHR